MPPLPADSIHARACKLKCEKILTRPLSELLRDMPSDEVLFQLDRERGNLNGDRKRHRVSNQDLYLLQQRQAGRTYRSIGEELGMSPKAVRHRILRIKVGLKWYLAVDLDVPALFN